ncbi:AAA family ATPase [Thermodesulfobacteriota bacterium]
MIRLRRVKIDKDIERKIIIAMIVSTPFCQKIRSLFKYEYFEIGYAKKVTKWVWEYFDQYGKAPGVHIQDIYETEKGELKEAEQNLVEYFLESLSEEFKKEGLLNEDYLVDEAHKYFTKREIEDLIERAQLCLSKGYVDKAQKYIKKFEGIAAGGLKDRLLKTMVYGDEFVSAEIEKPPLFISPWLTQDSITMIYGPRGLGKTWLAMIIAVSLTRENASEIEIGPWRTLRSAGVLFVDGEMEESMLQERVKILSSALGEEDLRNPLVLLSAHRYVKDHSKSEISLTADEFRDTIFNILNEREEIKVMILDNLSALATGIDENLKKEWDPINQWLISLRHLGVSVLISRLY